jgi:hypothetical protein
MQRKKREYANINKEKVGICITTPKSPNEKEKESQK